MNAWGSRPRRAIAALVITVLSAVPGAGAGTGEVVIRPTGVEPGLYRTTTERRVDWVNRSQRPAHLEFVGRTGEHRVFQIPGRIWAVFHRPGRHAYVVHLEGARPLTIHGSIDVVAERPVAEAGTCATITVMEACLEP